MSADSSFRRPPTGGRFLTLILAVAVLALGIAAHPALADPDSPEDTARAELAIDFESEVFARRGEAVVTQADIDVYLSRIPEADRAGVLSDPKRVGRMLDDLMLTRLVAMEGLKDGLLDDENVQAHLYQAAMVYLAERQMERVKSAGELEDYTRQARELYLRNPEAFRQQERVDFTHLLITEQDRSEDEARELIHRLKQRIEDGEAMGALILEYSEDPSVGENYGRFRDRTFENINADFADALRALESPGQISDPVKTRFGWHLIRLDGYQEPGVPEFEEIADQLREQARRNHRQRIEEQYIRRLLESDTELVPGALDALLERYPAPDEMSLRQ